jgi:hypothetical protein
MQSQSSALHANDPLPHRQERGCFVCYEGVVYIGKLVEGEDGEEVEVVEAVACRRYHGEEKGGENSDQ